MHQPPGYFEFLWSILWRWIQASALYRILRAVYDGIAGAWQKSRIASWFRRQIFPDGTVRKSLVGRVCGFPFAFFAQMQRRFGASLALAIEKSRILGVCRVYLENALALNLRFGGMLLLGLGLGGFVCGAELRLLFAALAAVGALLSIWDANLTDWLSGSWVIRFFCHCLGVSPSFAWYKKEAVGGGGRCVLALLVGLLSGLLGGLTEPLLGFCLPFVLAGGFLILSRPIAGVFAIVFLAPLAPTMLMAGLGLFCLFSLLLKSVADPDFRWRYDGVGFLTLAFLAVLLFAGVTSFVPIKSLSIWAIYAVFVSAYFVVINLVKTRKQLWQLLTVFVLSGFLVSLYGLAQYFFGWNISQAWMDEHMFGDIKMRIYSTLGNPNVLGEYFLLALPVSVGLFWTSKGGWQKLTYAAIAAAMLLALILTYSRGCWLGLLLAAAIFITFVAGKLWGLALIALPLLPSVLPDRVLNRFTSIGDMTDTSTSYRVYIWMGTFAMIRDFWVSGIGMGSEAFTAVYPFYSYNGIVAPHSHNLFLQILVESGVVGIVLFLLLMIFFFKRMCVGYQDGGGKGKPLSVMITAISAGVCGFLLQGLFDNCFYNYRVMLVFWQVLAMAMACCAIAKNAAGGEDAL